MPWQSISAVQNPLALGSNTQHCKRRNGEKKNSSQNGFCVVRYLSRFWSSALAETPLSKSSERWLQASAGNSASVCRAASMIWWIRRRSSFFCSRCRWCQGIRCCSDQWRRNGFSSPFRCSAPTAIIVPVLTKLWGVGNKMKSFGHSSATNHLGFHLPVSLPHVSLQLSKSPSSNRFAHRWVRKTRSNCWGTISCCHIRVSKWKIESKLCTKVSEFLFFIRKFSPTEC